MTCSPDNRLKARHGEDCATVLTEPQAREILRRRRIGQSLMAEARLLSNTALAEKYDISHKAVSRIIAGKRWKTADAKPSHNGMTYADAVTLRDAAKERDRLKSMAAEHSVKRLALQYGVSENMVTLIGTGERWVYLYHEQG